MKNIIIITFSFLFFSCNSSNKKVESWTEEDKDIVFRECINYSLDRFMELDEANEFCYCSLDIIIQNFDNREIATEQISKNPSLSNLWIGCRD